VNPHRHASKCQSELPSMIPRVFSFPASTREGSASSSIPVLVINVSVMFLLKRESALQVESSFCRFSRQMFPPAGQRRETASTSLGKGCNTRGRTHPLVEGIPNHP